MRQAVMERRIPKIPVSMLSLFLIGIAHGSVELVRDGKPMADIVIATNALSSVQLAAADLQEHLERMSGATLPIVAAPAREVKNHVYVGESEHTRKLGFRPGKFQNSALEIVVENNYVICAGPDIQRSFSRFMGPGGLERWHEFCGEKFNYGRGGEGVGEYNEGLKIFTNDDLGTWYAVDELLEQLGVRFYAPYEDGTVIPSKTSIAIPEQHLVKEAAFARREFCFYNAMRRDPDGIAWFKRLKLGNHSIIVYNHTTDDVFGPKEQKELHPEYLACDADGKPYPGYPDGHGMPRFSNPGFRKAAALYMNRRFDAVPELTAMSLSPPDGGLQMDARDVSRYGAPTDDMGQKMANYIWEFNVYLARELKQAHPDKYLLYGSTSNARGVPTNIEEFPDNLIIPFAQPYSAYRVLKTTDRAVIAQRQEWFARMNSIRKGPVWDYFLYYRTPDMPRYPVFFTESLQNEMQEMLPYSDGKFIEIQNTKLTIDDRDVWQLNTPGLIHLMVYWQSKLFWDPNMDRTAMLAEYYTLFFGPAWKEMKEFHEFAEEVWIRQESRSVTETTGFLKEPDVDRYFEILKRAIAKAGVDTVYARRIARMEDEMASLRTFFESLKRTGPMVRAYRTKADGTIDGDLGEYPEEWYTQLRVNRTAELPVTNKTMAFLALPPDNSALIVGLVCYEDQMDKLKADCILKDTFSIFYDDLVEVYVNTPTRSYFKVAVNPNGVIWDETTDVTLIDRDTLPLLWNPGTKAAIKKYNDRWTAEIVIPTADLAKSGPTRDAPWGIQVGRTRFAGEAGGIGYSISPTHGPYRLLNRWGNLYCE